MSAYLPSYNSQFYMQDLQNMKDRIDNQMRQLQQQNQITSQQLQQPQIQQTFQLSNPNSNLSDFDGKYVENVEEVKNTLTLKNTLFMTKDLNNLWIKDASGNIRAFSLSEIVQRDEKDIEIDNLKKELSEMKAFVLSQNKQNNSSTNVQTNSSNRNTLKKQGGRNE